MIVSLIISRIAGWPVKHKGDQQTVIFGLEYRKTYLDLCGNTKVSSEVQRRASTIREVAETDRRLDQATVQDFALG